MARMSFLSRRRSEEPAPEPEAEAAPAPHRRPLPSPSRLRRERRTLLRVREERIRDLGGLVLEMYRRQGFRQDLVDARCECGAPILWGSHFCANCGRPHGDRPVVACASCGAALPAEAKFCASCGKPVATAES